jgi:outer membrane protein OmpA-like peptidoglycan-associated protein
MLRTRLLAACTVFALSNLASAQEATIADPYSLAPLQAGSLLEVWATDPLLPGQSALALGLQSRPQGEVVEASQPEPPVAISSLSTLELLGTIGAWQDFDVSLGVAATSVDAGGAAEDYRTSLGDLRLVPRLRLWGSQDGSGGALLLDMAAPVGNDPLGSRHDARAEPRVALSEVHEFARMTLNAGYRVHADAGALGSSTLDTMTWGVGAGVPVSGAWAGIAELSGRWLPRGDETWRERSPIEARLAARFAPSHWAATLGGGIGILGGRAEAGWRLLATVSISPPLFPERHPGTAERNAVSNSLASEDDACSRALMLWDGSAIPPACAVEGDAVTYEASAESECADDPARCERAAAVASTCADGDGDALTCDETADSDPGERDEPLPRIEAYLEFAPNSYSLDRSLDPVLDEVAAQMKKAPDGVRFVVEGHSDASGPVWFNSKLSQARAIVVRRLLIRRGVPWKRVTVVWYGATQPMNDGDEARNRRVQFAAERTLR